MKKLLKRRSTLIATVLAVVAASCFVGCARKTPDGMPKLYPCSITLTQGNAPLADATVTLVNDSLEWAVSGTTDEKGVAVIYTHGTYAGAPEGDYVVVVQKQIVEKPTVQQQSASDDIIGGVAYNCVSEEFGSKTTSPLKLEVKGKTTGSFDVGEAIREEVKRI